ncbi:MAG: hypothetical protein M3R41_05510, partial [Pseudomonadota bacterium]|nr:hypothetical protein [Pseudomonadota bacterium]
MAGRRLSAEEAALWAGVMATVRPIVAMPATGEAAAAPRTVPHAGRQRAAPVLLDPIALELLRHAGLAPASPRPPTRGSGPTSDIAPTSKAAMSPGKPRATSPANTLDGAWDRALARGAVMPDRTID